MPLLTGDEPSSWRKSGISSSFMVSKRFSNFGGGGTKLCLLKVVCMGWKTEEEEEPIEGKLDLGGFFLDENGRCCRESSGVHIHLVLIFDCALLEASVEHALFGHVQFIFLGQPDFLQLHPLLCRAEAGVLLGSSCNYNISKEN
ncbi:CHASE domain containing histidine kinase protein [Striga asiatica]|uniref:CHASE domain containing histidine kinase protein n=1 Tax=Striga asiatica TaxID=4170 RepID=A0A5A7PMZ1_STRAF|nr:CHASE domain containing histidine kinase protein [Striga asiatica]